MCGGVASFLPFLLGNLQDILYHFFTLSSSSSNCRVMTHAGVRVRGEVGRNGYREIDIPLDGGAVVHPARHWQ